MIDLNIVLWNRYIDILWGKFPYLINIKIAKYVCRRHTVNVEECALLSIMDTFSQNKSNEMS